MSINTTLLIFHDGGRPPSKIFKSLKYQLLVWRAIHYYVRTYAKNFCHTQVLRFFRTCYSLSVRKKLSYVRAAHDDRIIIIECLL